VAIEGYLYLQLPALLRISFFVAALTLIAPGLVTDCIGFILSALNLCLVFCLRKKNAGGSAPA
jgi:TRAP-type uncharacterized transport system fused permease subunit